MNAQMRSNFENQSLLTSSRTKELARSDARAEKEKAKISKMFINEEAQEEACKKMLRDIEERREAKAKSDEIQRVINDAKDEEDLITNDDGKLSRGFDSNSDSDSDSD